jgi:tRNA A37 methylthiotransferase MiaB
MPSFDIASKVDLQTLDNAINTVKKEIDNRFDFKNSHVVITLNKKDYLVQLEADSDMKLKQIIDVQTKHSKEWNEKEIGNIHHILIEGPSKRSDEHLCGRNGRNAMVVFPKGNLVKGTYCWVKITDCTSATLIGEVVDEPK